MKQISRAAYIAFALLIALNVGWYFTAQYMKAQSAGLEGMGPLLIYGVALVAVFIWLGRQADAALKQEDITTQQSMAILGSFVLCGIILYLLAGGI